MRGPLCSALQAAALVSLALAAVTRAAETPGFRRMVFEQKIKLQSEAPGVAASGHRVAFSDQSTLILLDIRSGAVVLKRDLSLPGEEGSDEAEVLGFAGDQIVVSLMHEPGRPDPGGSVGRMSFGPQRGHFEILTVGLPAGDATPLGEALQVKRLFKLPLKVRIAPGLLEGRLVYIEDQNLHIRSFDGTPEKIFAIGDKAWFRPKIRGRSVFGQCERSAYVYHPDAPELIRTSCVGTALGLLLGRDTDLELCGDLFLASSREALVACDFEGKERWRLNLPFWPVGGSDRKDVICVRSGNVLLGLDPKDGRVRWRNYCKFGYYRIPAFVTEGRLVVFAEQKLGVFDARTGACQLCIPQDRDLVRRVSYGGTIFMRTAVAGNTLVLGYETWVYGVDLTPVPEVPKEAQARDMAYYKRETDEWHRSNDREISLWKKRAQKPEDLVPLLAAHLDQKTRVSLLEHVIADAKEFSLDTRDLAARFLRLDVGDWLAAEERRLLFSTPQADMATEFTNRLGHADAGQREAALKLLNCAPDAVLVALEGKLAALPDPQERKRGEELVRGAKVRLSLMSTVPRALAR